MKSMLHEASSVIKAIEKAWIESGKPLEFMVKVLEAGEKNFFGLSKRPAIVSIAYDPRKQAAPKAPERKEFSVKNVAGEKYARPQKMRQQQQRSERFDDRLEIDRHNAPKPAIQRPQRPTVVPQQENVEELWTQEMINDVSGWIKEMVGLLNIDSTYTIKADKRALMITFDKALLPTHEEERQFFIGLSYMVIQFLKKKQKRKLRGYHLVINTKEHATSDKHQ